MNEQINIKLRELHFFEDLTKYRSSQRVRIRVLDFWEFCLVFLSFYSFSCLFTFVLLIYNCKLQVFFYECCVSLTLLFAGTFLLGDKLNAHIFLVLSLEGTRVWFVRYPPNPPRPNLREILGWLVWLWL